MSKARIKRVRAERDQLAAEVDALRAHNTDLTQDLAAARDVVGWWDPGKDDAFAKRDELWEIVN